MRLTQAQFKMLKSARDTGNPWHHLIGTTRSFWGGSGQTYYCLKRRGLLDRSFGEITQAGRDELTKAEFPNGK